MSDQDWLAERFEEHRARLRQVAYRILGSAAEADDAVQDAWLRANRAGARELASRGRRRVRIAATPERSLEAQREVVDAFFAAARRGDFEALISVLDPEVVLRSDGGAEAALSASVDGAAAVAGRALMFANPAATLHPVVGHGR